MRLLDQKGIAYTFHSYACTEAISATEVAAVLGQDVERVFKTLVTVGKSMQHYVFIVPACAELNLKKLEAERGMLGIGGSSKVLRDLVKIVWINQTRTLRLFTTQDHGARIEPYVETVVRRTFGTPDAMKRGKKRPPNDPNQNP